MRTIDIARMAEQVQQKTIGVSGEQQALWEIALQLAFINENLERLMAEPAKVK